MSHVIEEGLRVTNETDAEEHHEASVRSTFHSSSSGGSPFSKTLPGRGAHLGLGGMGDSNLGQLGHPWMGM